MKMNKTEQKFITAYDKYSDDIFRHCFFRVFDRELAKDITQDTFTKTWKYLSEGNEIKNLRAFLYKTATNLIIDHTRKKKEQSLEQITKNGFEPKTENQEVIENSIDAEIIIKISEKIEEKYRTVLLMRYVDGLKPRQIAEITGEKKNTISIRIHRGLKKLKELLKYENI